MFKRFSVFIMIGALLITPAPVFAAETPTDNRENRTENNQSSTDQINILFKEGVSKDSIERFEEKVDGEIVKTDVLDYGTLCVIESDDSKEVIDYANSARIVEAAEENILLQPASVIYTNEIANDTYSKDQWNLDAMQVENAWDVAKAYKKQKTKIAVIDTGCEVLPDLKENVNYNMFADTSEDGEQDPVDNNGHGTEVASVIAATANNNSGIAGIGSGWDNDLVEVVPYKTESDIGITVNAFQVAMNKAVEDGCDVINISLVVDVDAPGIKQAIDHAYESGAVIVAAAGNDNTTDKMYPAAYDNVIGVISTDKSNTRSYDSNHGDWAFISAPGNDISVLTRDGSCKKESGTSFSAPSVAAIIGMMKAVDPNMTQEEIAKALKETSTDISDKSFDSETGWGIANAWKAVKKAAKDTSTIPVPTISNLKVTSTDKNIVITHDSQFPVNVAVKGNGYSKALSNLPKTYTLPVPDGKYTVTATASSTNRYNRITERQETTTSSPVTTTVTIKSKADVQSGNSKPGVQPDRKPENISKAKLYGIANKAYTGKSVTLPVSISLGGKTLKNGTDYTVSYSNNKNVGNATVIIKGKGNYTGTIRRTFTILPKTVNIQSLSSKAGKITITWGKQLIQNDGYQIQYSTDKNFRSNTKSIKISNNKQYLKVLTGFKKGKTYYVRIRGYKQAGKGTVFSVWGKTRSVVIR